MVILYHSPYHPLQTTGLNRSSLPFQSLAQSPQLIPLLYFNQGFKSNFSYKSTLSPLSLPRHFPPFLPKREQCLILARKTRQRDLAHFHPSRHLLLNPLIHHLIRKPSKPVPVLRPCHHNSVAFVRPKNLLGEVLRRLGIHKEENGVPAAIMPLEIRSPGRDDGIRDPHRAVQRRLVVYRAR